MKLLILRLEGVLQSWGERSHWDHRGTSSANDIMSCQIEDIQGEIARSDQPVDASHNRYAIRRVRYEVVRREETPCI